MLFICPGNAFFSSAKAEWKAAVAAVSTPAWEPAIAKFVMAEVQAVVAAQEWETAIAELATAIQQWPNLRQLSMRRRPNTPTPATPCAMHALVAHSAVYLLCVCPGTSITDQVAKTLAESLARCTKLCQLDFSRTNLRVTLSLSDVSSLPHLGMGHWRRQQHRGGGSSRLIRALASLHPLAAPVVRP